jgi:putative glutamine amidotransferase
MSKKKPIIGITTSATKGHFPWLCIKLGVFMAGGTCKRLTALNHNSIYNCDGYIIAGGGDIDPKIYGQKNKASIKLEPERDELELEVIKYAVKHKKPLLGICRGSQMINISRGGNLHQNAIDFYKNFIPNDSLIGKIFLRRKICIVKNGLLATLFKPKKELWVNSIHHQAIKDLGKGLKATTQDEHKIVQSIEDSGKDQPFILGVQWHPEFMLYSRLQRSIFKIFVRLC